MADKPEMRQWLADNGRPPPARGPVSKADREFYEAAHASIFDDPDQGVTEADFTALDEEEPSVPLAPERPPRTPRASRQKRSSPLRLLSGTSDSKSKDKRSTARKAPRISVERLTGKMWGGLGRMFGGVSPAMGNCMQIQAPIAGMLLNEVVQGSIVDKVLQPMARAEEKWEKVFALGGPPLCVLAIEHAQTLEPKEAAIRTALIMPVLREGLGAWLDVAGDKVEAAAQRRQEYAEKSAAIDAMIAAIFSQPRIYAEPEQEQEPEMAGAAS